MKRNKVKKLLSQDAPLAAVTVMGWIRFKRSSKKITFLALNDGSCQSNLQVIVDPDVSNYEQIRKANLGSSICVRGNLVESPAKGQKWELHTTEITIIGQCSSEYPLQKKYQTFEYLRTIAHLRPRTNTFGAVFRIRNTAAFAINDFFYRRGFMYVHTPIITGSNCEGAGDMFHVTTLDLKDVPKGASGEIHYAQDFFGKEAGLTVSGQLEAELFAMGFSDVYTFGPTFRAENSNTSRHAAEFWMIEPEMAFYDLHDTIDLARDFFKHMTSFVLQENKEDLDFLNERVDKTLIQRLEKIMDSPFQVMTYTEAITHLEKSDQDFEYPVTWGVDLQSEHERYLTETIVGGPVFVINYPKEIKAFYMRLNDDQKTVAAMDLLVPKIGEIIGGSQREERHDVLVHKIKELGLPIENYWWYLDLRRFGTVPHSGFGLGFERALMYLTGMANIRDVIPFPRTPGSVEF